MSRFSGKNNGQVCGLKLGEMVLDPRRVVFVPGIKAVACSGLLEALAVSDLTKFKSIVERIDNILDEYNPDSLILFSELNKPNGITGIVKRWGNQAKIHFISSRPNPEVKEKAEILGCEVHHELVWGNYRFVENAGESTGVLPVLTISSKPSYVLEVKGGKVRGVYYPVFLKGLGHLLFPSINPKAQVFVLSEASLPSGELNSTRFDVFAIGPHRVLPLGKIEALTSKKTLSVAQAALAHRLGRNSMAPKASL